MSLVDPVSILKQIAHLTGIKYTRGRAGGRLRRLPYSLLHPYSHLKEVSVNKTQKFGGKYHIVTDTKMSLVLRTEPIALFVIKKN